VTAIVKAIATAAATVVVFSLSSLSDVTQIGLYLFVVALSKPLSQSRAISQQTSPM